jgi:hypothetical protein
MTALEIEQAINEAPATDLIRMLATMLDELSNRISYLENRLATSDSYEWEMRDRG